MPSLVLLSLSFKMKNEKKKKTMRVFWGLSGKEKVGKKSPLANFGPPSPKSLIKIV